MVTSRSSSRGHFGYSKAGAQVAIVAASQGVRHIGIDGAWVQDMADDRGGQADAGHGQAPEGRGAGGAGWRAAQVEILVFVPSERCDGAREQQAARQQRSAAVAQALFDDRLVPISTEQIFTADDSEESFIVDGVMVGALKGVPRRVGQQPMLSISGRAVSTDGGQIADPQRL
jgi:hypothetical protein